MRAVLANRKRGRLERMLSDPFKVRAFTTSELTNKLAKIKNTNQRKFTKHLAVCICIGNVIQFFFQSIFKNHFTLAIVWL